MQVKGKTNILVEYKFITRQTWTSYISWPTWLPESRIGRTDDTHTYNKTLPLFHCICIPFLWVWIRLHCWESTYCILHKLSNIWFPVTFIYCLISYIQGDYLNFNIAYFGVTIWHPFTIWHLFINWHLFKIVTNILTCLLAKTWELLTIILQSISSI